MIVYINVKFYLLFMFLSQTSSRKRIRFKTTDQFYIQFLFITIQIGNFFNTVLLLISYT